MFELPSALASNPESDVVDEDTLVSAVGYVAVVDEFETVRVGMVIPVTAISISFTKSLKIDGAVPSLLQFSKSVTNSENFCCDQ
jgi:hypothetical protein